jgi:hypothetical protein
MKPVSRRIIFFFFLFSFFASAGLVTFFTLGYRYNFERNILVYTGSATVKSNPETVTIIVDKQPGKADIHQLNGSYHITGLKPGEHFLEVNADGYQTWSKKFIVNSKISTEFWNVTLARTDYSKTSYPTDPVNKVFPSPKSSLLAFVSLHDSGFSVNTLDIATQEAAVIFNTPHYVFDRRDKENIEWSIDADYVSVPAIKDNRKSYLIVNTVTKDVFNLGDIAQLDGLRTVRWDSSRNTVLFAIAESTLYEIDIAQPETKRILSSNVHTYDISGNDLYILEIAPSNIIYKTSLGSDANPIILTSLPFDDDIDDLSHSSLIAYDENRLTVINYSTGKLFVYNKIDPEHMHTFRIDRGAAGTQFSDDGKKMLYWTDKELFVYFTRDWDTQPIRQAHSSITLGRFSQNIANVHWSKDYEHATFSVNGTIKLIELDPRGEKSIMDIVSLPQPPIQIISNFAENMLFYTLARHSDRESSQEETSLEENTATSFHDQTLFSIDFPEEVSGFFSTR